MWCGPCSRIADAPAGLTIPAEQRPDQNAVVLNGAGDTGYLSGWVHDGFNWTTYADKVTKPLPMPAGMEVAYGTGTDTVTFRSRDGRSVTQRNMKDGSERTWTLPVGQEFFSVFGDTVVTSQKDWSTTTLHALTWRNGSVNDRPTAVFGDYVNELASNGDGLFAITHYSGFTWVYWLDASGSRLTKLAEVDRTEVSGGHVAQWAPDGRVKVWDMAALDKPAAHEFTVSGDDDARLLGTVGDHVLIARRISADGGPYYSSLNYRIVAVPFGGGPERQVLERATAMPRFTADGTMLIGRAEGGRKGVVAVRAPGADGSFSVTEVEVNDLDAGEYVYRGPDSQMYSAYALHGATLWVESGTGSVDAIDVRRGKTLGTAKVSDCDLTSLQANGVNILWECGSSASGVYDSATGRGVALPAHQDARLGDGYVAWQQGGVLDVTDVRGGSGTRTLGSPKQAAADKGWAVDRFGGPVAHADAEDAIHVVPTGVPTSALSAIDADTPARVNANSGSWKPRWWLSKPAASWQLTVKDVTGATVRTLTGGQTRGLVRPEWDGKADDGRYAANGGYAWTLTATPADGQGAALTRTGTVGLTGAGAVARDIVGAGGPDGRADLLALTPSGRFDLRTGPGVATSAQAVGEGWTGANAMTAAIAFRDVNGDRCNDVLVRMAAGELRAYTPPCGAALTLSTAYQSLGKGWNAYDTLVSPGDVDGDGRPDLVARTPGGDLYVYSDNGALGFKDPVKAGWAGAAS